MMGVPPQAGSGHSAEPELISVVSAETASVPNAGVFGDCYRACLAHILGVSRHDVPHFGAHGRNQNEATNIAREWLAERGLTVFECWSDDKTKLSTILDAYSRQNPGAPIILHGQAAHKGGEVNHAVVMLDGAIAYDPSGAGICGPAIQSDNEGANWWMEVLVPRALSEPPALTTTGGGRD